MTNAVQTTGTNPKAPAKQRKRRMSPKIVEAIRLIASGEVRTQTAAAKRVGVSEQWLSTMLGREETRVLLEQTCRKFLRTGKVRATARLVELLESPSQRTALEASKHILAVEGIAPPREGMNINLGVDVSVGYIIDLRGPDDRSPLIDVTETPSSAGPAASKGYER